MRTHVLCDAVAAFPEPVADAMIGWTQQHQDWSATHVPTQLASDGGWLLHFHAFVVEAPQGLVLVDLGVGTPDGPAGAWLGVGGRLPTLLHSMGATPADISTVILTHAHLDHVGWSLDDAGAPRFLAADYVLQQRELDAMSGSETFRALLEPIRSADQLRTVDGDHTLLPGLRMVLAPGHTPGHQVVIAEDTILCGDAMVHPAQAEWPDLAYRYEVDSVLAAESRRALFGLAAALDATILSSHLAVGLHAADGARALPDGAVCPGT